MRHQPSSRKPALKNGWKLPALERHQQRLKVAKMPGCRRFLAEFAASVGLELSIRDNGGVWVFTRRGRFFAAWKPWSAGLKFRGVTYHCHDCFQVKHELQLRLAGGGNKKTA